LHLALFEALPGPADREIIELAEIDAVVERAKAVRQEAASFFAGGAKAKPDAEKPGSKKRLPADANEGVASVERSEGAGSRGRSVIPNVDGSRGAGELGSAREALEHQIARSMRQRPVPGSGGLGGGDFAADGADSEEECMKPASDLSHATVCEGAGGGQLLADSGSHSLLRGAMSATKQAQLLSARELLDRAKELVVRSVPSLKDLVQQAVKAGWDGANQSYAGYCANGMIVINLAPMVNPLAQGHSLPKDAAHELTLTVCHELAHLLERGSGHGAKWRATQDALVQAVLLTVSGTGLQAAANGPFAGLGGCQCGTC